MVNGQWSMVNGQWLMSMINVLLLKKFMKSTTKKEIKTKKDNIKKNSLMGIILRNPIPYIFIIVISMTIYSQTFKYSIINLDDEIVKDNYPLISKISNIGLAFKSDNFFHSKGNYYRPILTTSLILDAQMAGNKYYIYHITNAILHCLISCLLFYLFILLNFNRLFSLVSSLIFASHPLAVNAVAWIAGRNDLLPTLFFLLSFIMLIKYLEKKNIIYLISHFLSYGLALFSKETSLIFPVFYIIYIIFRHPSVSPLTKGRLNAIVSPLSKGGLRGVFFRNIMFLAIWSFLILFFMILRSQVVPNSTDYQNPFQNVFDNISIIPELLTKLFIPYNLAPLPFYNSINVIIGLIILATLVFFIFSIYPVTKNHRMNNRFLTIFGLLFFILLLLPGTIIKYGGGQFFDYLECRAYLPVIGIFITLGSLPYIDKIFSLHKNLLIISCSIIIIIFSLLTLNLSKVYSEPLIFTNYAIEKSPRSAFAWNSKGLILENSGKFREAIECFDKATEIKPDYSLSWSNKANALFNYGNAGDAIKCYDKSLEITNDNSQVWYNKGNVLYYMGNGAEAIKLFDKALELNPDYFEAWFNKGIVYENLEKYEDAVKCFDEALKLRPDNPDAWFNKAKALDSQGKYEDAIKYYDKCLEIKRDYTEALINKGIAFRNLGKAEEAIKCYDKSIQIKPDFIEAWINKGNALIDLEKYEEAVKCYDKAIEIKPANAETWNYKGRAKYILKQYEESIKCYNTALQIKPDFKEAFLNREAAMGKINQAKKPQFKMINK